MSESELQKSGIYAIWADDCYVQSEHYKAGLQALARFKGLTHQNADQYIDHYMPDLWECLHKASARSSDTLYGDVSDQAVAGLLDLVAVETLGKTIYASMIDIESGEPPRQTTVLYTNSGLDDMEGCFTFYGPHNEVLNNHYKCTRYTLDSETWSGASDLLQSGENPNQVYRKQDDDCFTAAVCKSLKADKRYPILSCDSSARPYKNELEPGKSDPDVKEETDYSSTSHTLSDIPIKASGIKKEPGVEFATQ